MKYIVADLTVLGVAFGVGYYTNDQDIEHDLSDLTKAYAARGAVSAEVSCQENIQGLIKKFNAALAEEASNGVTPSQFSLSQEDCEIALKKLDAPALKQ